MVKSVTSIVYCTYYYAYRLKTLGKYVEIILIRNTQHHIIITLLHNIYYI